MMIPAGELCKASAVTPKQSHTQNREKGMANGQTEPDGLRNLLINGFIHSGNTRTVLADLAIGRALCLIDGIRTGKDERGL